MDRRFFIKTGSLGAAGAIAAPFVSAAETKQTKPVQVKFTTDSSDFSTEELSKLLYEISGKTKIAADNYLLGGVVETLEKKCAELLGKEAAVFLPTGTMANHIALRKLAGEKKRVLVQAESHIYNDSGDCCQTLSGLNLIPLAPGKTSFTLGEFRDAVFKGENGRVRNPTGVISIESPVRRKNNEVFDYEEMKAICREAKDRGIKLHLDGARLFFAALHTGVSAAEYASYFDTVYVSLYKTFDTPSGAILAGTHEFCRDLFHIRRMMGGGMHQAWPFAAVALYHLDSFFTEYKMAMQTAKEFIELINKNSNFKAETIPGGTNVFKLEFKKSDPLLLLNRLSEKNIFLPPPVGVTFYPRINITLNRTTAEKLAREFIAAL